VSRPPRRRDEDQQSLNVNHRHISDLVGESSQAKARSMIAHVVLVRMVQVKLNEVS
jgi:hypothetical protein